MNHKYKYGQKDYDFDEGILFFIAPNQVLRIETEENSQPPSGWMLLIHPDFLWNKNLAKAITQYEFFDYSLHEALFLSDDEEQILVQLIENIRQEYNTNTDKFISDIFFVGIFDCIYGICIFLTFTTHQRIIGKLNSFPSFIPIHGIVSSTNWSNPSNGFF